MLGHTPQLETDGMDRGVSEPDVMEGAEQGEVELFEDDSADSDDSFHSTTDLLGIAPLVTNQLYASAAELVAKGGVKCRKIRWAWPYSIKLYFVLLDDL